ncbi:hypothetical protein M885DRAFT_532295 [Pelagophyceae sp. CCMP2097]|nr:hypothetical protein M885DRAFT_532295 [Pelagophyceae sp. CCMP2097]|mmetsp:Transcript_10188/g.36031  ORF Transcript_10188/g.36031 Transcript_10188/m.36031 type:complete len:885 (+) Transcript_10188:125-2779(+)
MRDLIPSWLEDPGAYAQPANLDLQTVLIVAATNFVVAAVCVAAFEVVKRRPGSTAFCPKEALMPGSTPRDVVHGNVRATRWPLAWVLPLLKLDEATLLRCGGYDVVVYLRFIDLSFKIFACFAPYALCILLPVNVSTTYFLDARGHNSDKDLDTNAFNVLSMSNMPMRDRRMWAHCVGAFLLTGITMHFLAKDCVWYMHLRHQFLAESSARQRTILVEKVPFELRSSKKLATYFGKLYPGKVVGSVSVRRVSEIDAVMAQRTAAVARHDRCVLRRVAQKNAKVEYGGGEPWCLGRKMPACDAHRLLEDAFDPTFYGNKSLAERTAQHAATIRKCDETIDRLRSKHNRLDSLVGRDAASAAADGAAAAKKAPKGLIVDRLPDVVARNPFDDDVGNPLVASEFMTGDSMLDSEDLDFGSQPAAPLWRRLLPKSLGGRDAVSTKDEARGLLRAPGKLFDKKALWRTVGDKAFVTFSAFAAAAVATQVFHAAPPGKMIATMAPEPRDVCWRNMHLPQKERQTRRFLVGSLVFLLLVFYIVPVTLISLVLSESALKARSPAIAALAARSLAFDACVKMCQPMGLIGLMLLLPPAFLALGVWEGRLSWSDNASSQLARYYAFQITNVLLVTTVAGSLVKCIHRILDDPASTFKLLGESLPGVCAFFSCYVFIKAFSGLSLELCRAVAAFQQGMKRCVYPSATPRDKEAQVLGLRDFDHPGWFSYGKYGAQDLLVQVLLMAYSVMAPIILLPGLLFFGWASIVYRHQLLYVYTPVFESGGLLWPKMYRRTLFSLFVMQFTMIGIFFLKHAFFQGYAVIALSLATYAYKFKMRVTYTMASSVAHKLPLDLAVELDGDSEGRDGGEQEALLRGLAGYLQPALQSTPHDAADPW